MKQTLSFLSEYKAHNNSECRTSFFSTVNTGKVFFIANYEKILTIIAAVFGQMGKKTLLKYWEEFDNETFTTLQDSRDNLYKN